jgi:7-carboxy-7-deazaguanine synthase
MTYQYRVSEIFGPTIQGEGAQIGRPTVFVRFGGCDYRCSWCDSLYAVLPEYRHTWESMDASTIVDKINSLVTYSDTSPDDSLPPVLVTLSGGNPALWNMQHVLEAGQVYDHTFTMETQGSLARPWFKLLNHLCISPKPPSSGMKTDWEVLEECIAAGPKDTILKVVVFNEADMEYAGKVREMAQGLEVPLYLQVGNLNPGQGEFADPLKMLTDLDVLSQDVIRHHWHDVRVLPQLHALMWGNKRAV